MTRGTVPARLRANWSALRGQYAVAGYLGWIGQEAAGAFLGRRPASWDDREMLARINILEGTLLRLPDEALQAASRQLLGGKTDEPFEARVSDALALVREASRRVLGLRHHDVQILGALAMCRGAVAEMATGEGKTLVQSLVAYVKALDGRGVHVATANPYLAARDHEFAQPLFAFLGVRSALLPERQTPSVKRSAYAADVTYGTGTEFGFDYLRDQLARLHFPQDRPGDRFARNLLGATSAEPPGTCQRGLIHTVVDEIDSILIDDATTPLVISQRAGETHPAPEPFSVARDLAGQLQEGEDFEPGPRKNALRLTPAGQERIQSPGLPVPWSQLKRPWVTYVENALRARHLIHRDVAYLVREGKVVIIDEATGRTRPDSSWRDGLHQAVEAECGLTVSAESETVASISRQRFYRLYESVTGMSGTVMPSAGEFWEVFRLPVTTIPRHRPSLAQRLPDRVFTSDEAKFRAVVEDIAERHRRGQPVLAGSRTIKQSEVLSERLRERSIPHQLLNARQDAEEAAIVASAGQLGAVTIATHMAGRGTHIGLGEGVAALGGLHVICLEMEESSRIDLQLMGRTARQGESGSAQMFLGAEDHILRAYAPDDASRLASAVSDASGEVPAAAWSPVFARAQRRVESARYGERVALLHRDKWLSETKLRIA